MDLKAGNFDLKKLNPREKGILAAVVMFGIGFLFYTFEYTVQEKKIKKAATQLKQLKTSIDSLQSGTPNAAQVRQTQKDIEDNKAKIEAMREEINQTRDKMKGKYLDILNELKREAQIHGAVLRSVSTAEKVIIKDTLTYKEVSLTLKIQSDYYAIGSFISALEKLPAAISVSNLETIRKDDILPYVETVLKLTLFVV